jgi:hypothetical protein
MVMVAVLVLLLLLLAVVFEFEFVVDADAAPTAPEDAAAAVAVAAAVCGKDATEGPPLEAAWSFMVLLYRGIGIGIALSCAIVRCQPPQCQMRCFNFHVLVDRHSDTTTASPASPFQCRSLL